jgi:erythronate-4-phosphate dehydrogenase
MKIVIDSDIPFLAGVFEPYFDIVSYAKGSSIDHSAVTDADALVIRTRTICNAKLLRGTRVKAIASATVGADHIDINYCLANSIKVFTAQGCNKGAVMQWVLSSVCTASEMLNYELKGKVFGVVGHGNIGSLVAKAAQTLGMEVLICDPPKQLQEGNHNYVDLNYLAKYSDFISFHVPLTYEGPFTTFNLANNEFFSSLKANAFIMNSARGGVVNENMLLSAINLKRISGCAIDVWQGEPFVLDNLLHKTHIATPHIAGYSIEGKINASSIVIDAISNFFSLGMPKYVPNPNPIEYKIQLEASKYLINNTINLIELLKLVYPIDIDSNNFKQNSSNFEEIRNSYPLRRENEGFEISACNKSDAKKLNDLGFWMNSFNSQ